MGKNKVDAGRRGLGGILLLNAYRLVKFEVNTGGGKSASSKETIGRRVMGGGEQS